MLTLIIITELAYGLIGGVVIKQYLYDRKHGRLNNLTKEQDEKSSRTAFFMWVGTIVFVACSGESFSWLTPTIKLLFVWFMSLAIMMIIVDNHRAIDTEIEQQTNRSSSD